MAQRVVIIGAGIVGCAIADELTERGVTGVTVLDQGPLPLTGGSTSHAPGLVFQTNPSKMHTDLARYTVERLCAMPYGDDGEACFWQTGGLEIAITDARWAELHRRHGLAASWGVDGSILSPEECRALWPQIGDEVDLKGGYLVPTDGVARAVWACEEMTRRAEARGATFRGSTEVTGFVRDGGGRVVGVETPAGRLEADLVVVAAGMWAPKLGRLLGVSIPLVPLQHLFAWTTPLPSLERSAAETGREATRPILRHQDRDLYYREFGDRLGIGSYAHQPLPVEPEAILSPDQAVDQPSKMAFTPPDFASTWAETQALFPEVRQAAIDEGFNGLFSFTPDSAPLIGELPGAEGVLFSVAVWVTHSLRGRPVGRAADRGRPLADRPARGRHQPLRAVRLDARLQPAPRRPELHRGLRHPASAAADGGAAPAPGRARSGPGRGSSAPTSWRPPATSGPTGTRRTPTWWTSTRRHRRATPGRPATGIRSRPPSTCTSGRTPGSST